MQLSGIERWAIWAAVVIFNVIGNFGNINVLVAHYRVKTLRTKHGIRACSFWPIVTFFRTFGCDTCHSALGVPFERTRWARVRSCRNPKASVYASWEREKQQWYLQKHMLLFNFSIYLRGVCPNCCYERNFRRSPLLHRSSTTVDHAFIFDLQTSNPVQSQNNQQENLPHHTRHSSGRLRSTDYNLGVSIFATTMKNIVHRTSFAEEGLIS